MEDLDYTQWWPLHRRMALGEPLTVEELTYYEAGIQQLNSTEEQTLSGSKEHFGATCQRNLDLKANYNRLHFQIEEMEKEIILLEGRLDMPTKQLLGVEG